MLFQQLFFYVRKKRAKNVDVIDGSLTYGHILARSKDPSHPMPRRSFAEMKIQEY